MPREIDYGALTNIVQSVIDAECKRWYRRHEAQTPELVKAVYTAIYGACILALVRAGLSESELRMVDGLEKDIQDGMINAGFGEPVPLNLSV